MLAAVAAIVVALPASAVASEGRLRLFAPAGPQRGAIVKAFGDPPRAEGCLIVGLAASNHKCGSVGPRIERKCRRWEFNGVNVLERRTDDHWRILFEGSAFGCPLP